MKKITVKQIMSWRPCPGWTEDRVRSVIGKGKTPLEICDLPKVSVRDKLWCLLRTEIIPERELHLLSCILAERILLREREAGREPDKRSWEAIQAKRDWLDGKITDWELAVARAAARAVASDAKGVASCTVARIALWAAQEVATAAIEGAVEWVAEWSYTRAIELAAIEDVARATAYSEQLLIVRKVIEDLQKGVSAE